MRQSALERLLALNREFYQSFAEPFSETRSRLQSGVLRALEGLPPQASVLDLGCGNGELAAELQRRGHSGAYVGLDSSEPLLELARRQAIPPIWRFVQADLTEADWGERLKPAPALPLDEEGPAAGERSERPTGFDRVFAFAVLHHIPGDEFRTRLLRQVHGLLAPGGRLTLSVWNFLASPRLRRRILPWREAGLAEGELDPGDYLLDWRLGGRGLRYVHHFTEPELAGLAAASGFGVAGGYLADGESGVLGRYQVWEPVAW
ncbi:MAG TPA: class I SAM-dependent methyltransferase [Anaerolineales bacterium]